jgi:hypothetical protein
MHGYNLGISFPLVFQNSIRVKYKCFTNVLQMCYEYDRVLREVNEGKKEPVINDNCEINRLTINSYKDSKNLYYLYSISNKYFKTDFLALQIRKLEFDSSDFYLPIYPSTDRLT